MSSFVALKSSSPSLPLSTEKAGARSIPPPPFSLLVLLLLSEQPNEAEGQWSARATLAHYARIHSLSHKQSGRQHWKTKQATLSPLPPSFSLGTSLPSVCGCELHRWDEKKTLKKEKIPEREKHP